MSSQSMDAEMAESLAGVIRLLYRAGELLWTRADLEGTRSPWQRVALGIDLVADRTHSLLPTGVSIAGPQPAGDEPTRLLQSAAQLLLRLCLNGAPTQVHVLHSQVADLFWEANTGAGA